MVGITRSKVAIFFLGCCSFVACVKAASWVLENKLLGSLGCLWSTSDVEWTPEIGPENSTEFQHRILYRLIFFLNRSSRMFFFWVGLRIECDPKIPTSFNLHKIRVNLLKTLANTLMLGKTGKKVFHNEMVLIYWPFTNWGMFSEKSPSAHPDCIRLCQTSLWTSFIQVRGPKLSRWWFWTNFLLNSEICLEFSWKAKSKNSFSATLLATPKF